MKSVRSELEKVLGGKITSPNERTIPGLEDGDDFCTIYFSVASGRSPKSIFRRITSATEPPIAKHGAAVELGCWILAPNGIAFYALEIHGDIQGWSKDIEIGSEQEDLMLARIVGRSLMFQSGEAFDLSECEVHFY